MKIVRREGHAGPTRSTAADEPYAAASIFVLEAEHLARYSRAREAGKRVTCSVKPAQIERRRASSRRRYPGPSAEALLAYGLFHFAHASGLDLVATRR